MPEQSKKWLWIALSASAFALVVIGAAFIFFAPVKSSSPVPFDIRGNAEPRKQEPGEYLANEPPGMVTTQTTSGDIIIVYGNNPESTQTPSATSTTLAPTNVTPKSPAPTSAVPTTTLPPAQPKATATTIKVTPVTTTVPKPTATPTTVKKPQAPVAASSSGSNFWIQAGSFKVRESADSLKAAFAQKNLAAVIVVKDIDGKSYYQVRVGPYVSREDAKKWLTNVRAVPGSSQEAFVTQ
jgi:cell division protein FtsN